MKFILMLLVLFVLADPVLADPVLAAPALAQPVSNSAECQNMHRGLMNAYDAGKPVSQKQMTYFVDACMSESTADKNQAFSRKLVQKAEDVKHINIVRI